MKITNQKFLVAGLLAGALTFVGCKSEKSAERTPDTTQTAPPTGTGTTGTCTNAGTGGSGGSSNISTTKQSDDNLRMPEDDPLRLKDGDKSIRDAESEQGVHENTPAKPKLNPNNCGTGGSGSSSGETDDNLNDGGNVPTRLRIPDSPMERATPDGVTNDNTQAPEGAH